MTKPARADNFFGSCFTRQEKGVCDPELGNDFRELMCQFFSTNHNSTPAYFRGANTCGVCVGILVVNMVGSF